MGDENETAGDGYSKMKEDGAFRLEQAETAGLGFVLLGIPTKSIIVSEVISITRSEVMPIKIGAKRRWRLSSWRSDRHPSRKFRCFFFLAVVLSFEGRLGLVLTVAHPPPLCPRLFCLP